MNCSIVAPLALAAMTSTAFAHFKLNDPPSRFTQAANGDPQKTGSCGAAAATAATADVTNLTPGQDITIKVDVTTAHPGYFRVALAKGPDLPALPGGACDTLTPNPTPQSPILVEQAIALPATTGEKTITAKVPAGLNCTDCRLQVIQVMTEAGQAAGDCFYRHCATVNVAATVQPPGPGPGPGSGSDAGPDNGQTTSGGETMGGCATTSGQAGWLLVVLAAIAQLARRRRA